MLEERENSGPTVATEAATTNTTLPSTSTPQPGSRLNQISSQSYKIITQYGDMLVIKQGIQLQPSQQTGGGQASDLQQSNQQRPIIMTFHDLGLNSELQFATFCECEEVKLMLKTFTMIHVNFIGQEFPSQQQQSTQTTVSNNTLPDDFKYPNMEQMSESIVDVCAQLRIRSFIAIAVGAGAHIVGNLALMRPDLVDGLFLINPVITSCSITEWLYFKMSAIASNHSIGNWNSSIGGGKDWSILSTPTSLLSSSNSSNSTISSANHNYPPANHQNANKTSTTTTDTNHHHKHSHGIGLKRLLNAAHLHFPHHHNHQKQQNVDRDNNSETGSPELKQLLPTNEQRLVSEKQECSSVDTEVGSPSGIKLDDSKNTTASLENSADLSSPTTSINSSPISKAHHSGSRLRQLIFSRHIRNTVNQTSEHLSRTSSTSVCSGPTTTTSGDSGSSKHKHGSSKVKSSDSDDSMDSQRSGSAKRPPSEYLMYHHFGPVSFQTYRRSSDTPILTMFHNRDSPRRIQQRPQSGDSTACSDVGNNASKQNSGQCSPATPTTPRGSCRQNRGMIAHQASSSGSSINQPNTATNQEARGRGRCRSGSVCMDSIYLASFEDERQRSCYIQSVYKHYFYQINSHNLWLFAQSFAKRRSLNLRKDCGAAAHAAAAAANLGTSICSAFVGMTPSPSLQAQPISTSSALQHAPSSSSSRSVSNKLVSQLDTSSVVTTNKPSDSLANDTKADNNSSSQQLDDNSSSPPPPLSSTQDKTLINKQTAVTTTTDPGRIGQRNVDAASSTTTNAKPKQDCQQPKALVAGTKVKRTFTCQTLIMASRTHRERSFKLMSLLNPLHATWIQTDHLLVLEEKPEKVCQALRLFLQGIGYSMSTYERRLRLSSTTGSAGSADSNNSGPSLNEKH